MELLFGLIVGLFIGASLATVLARWALTLQREAAEALHEALVWSLAYLQQGVDSRDSDYYATVAKILAALSLAKRAGYE